METEVSMDGSMYRRPAVATPIGDNARLIRIGRGHRALALCIKRPSRRDTCSTQGAEASVACDFRGSPPHCSPIYQRDLTGAYDPVHASCLQVQNLDMRILGTSGSRIPSKEDRSHSELVGSRERTLCHQMRVVGVPCLARHPADRTLSM